jgi:hypothetical protein
LGFFAFFEKVRVLGPRFVKKWALKDWQHCCTCEGRFFRRISSLLKECKCLERLVVRNVNGWWVKEEKIQMGWKRRWFYFKGC